MSMIQPDALFVSTGGLEARITQPQQSPLTRAASVQARVLREIGEFHSDAPQLVNQLEELRSVPGNTHVPFEHTAKIVEHIRRVEYSFAELEQALSESQSLIEQLRSERGQLQALCVIAEHLNQTLNRPELYERILTDLMLLVQAERGAILLKDSQGNLRFEAALHNDGRQLSRGDFILSRSIIEQVWRSHRPLMINDAAHDTLSADRPSVQDQGITAIMCAPLVVESNVLGVVYVDRQSHFGSFSHAHVDLLSAFCNSAAIAIQNANLFATQQLHMQEIAAMKTYTDSILLSISSGVAALDNTGRITRVNSAFERILHVQQADVIDRPFDQVLSVIEDNALLQHIYSTIQLDDVQESMLVEAHIAGHLYRPGLCTLSVGWSALYNSERKRLGSVIVIDDLTDLAQAQRAAQIFRRYVHPEVVDLVVQHPSAAELGGELREISVIFADVRGYTRMSEGISPTQLVALLNQYLTMMTEAIFEMGGTVTMFQGDAIMAIFNAPAEQPDHALRAVRAAWKLHKSVERYNHQTGQKYPVRVGVGINTGQAVVGNIGAVNRIQSYTAIGDTVNSAKRLEEGATEGQILLAETTYLQVVRQANNLNIERFPDVIGKNKSQPMPAWLLRGIRE
jgi:adenylate cyclase